jgi:hypothetical protein
MALVPQSVGLKRLHQSWILTKHGIPNIDRDDNNRIDRVGSNRSGSWNRHNRSSQGRCKKWAQRRPEFGMDMERDTDMSNGVVQSRSR